MTIRGLHEMPWIGEDPVLDLANTVVVGAGSDGSDIDLLADEALAGRWRERCVDGDLAALPRDELEHLRGLVREALEAAAAQRPLVAGVRVALNELASSAPVIFQVADDGQLVQRGQGGDAASVVALHALVLAAGAERRRVRRCDAPSCGMFFLARRRDQAWCSLTCGNRARSTRRQALRG